MKKTKNIISYLVGYAVSVLALILIKSVDGGFIGNLEDVILTSLCIYVGIISWRQGNKLKHTFTFGIIAYLVFQTTMAAISPIVLVGLTISQYFPIMWVYLAGITLGCGVISALTHTVLDGGYKQ